MPRPQNPDLTKYWKICLPATLAGTVEFYLFDSLHKKPKYGSRGRLIALLLEGWVADRKNPEARAKLVFQRVMDVVTRDGSTGTELYETIKKALDEDLTNSPHSNPLPIPLEELR